MRANSAAQDVLGRLRDPRVLHNGKWRLLLMCAVWCASVALLVARLHHGFLPHDDPNLSHLAERTLHGELPGVDFYDGYTGGLSFLNALALRLFGVRLISARIMLLVFFIPWIPTVWYLASRITSPLYATAVTLLAAVWSVPVYPAPYATWYNLYFATFGTAALFRYLDTRHRRWIFLAGICGGISFLAKIFALYFIAAAGFFLIFDEQEENAESDARPKVTWSPYSIFLSLVLLAFIFALIKLISGAANSAGFLTHVASCYHFILPGAAVCLLLIYREWTVPRVSASARFAGFAARTIALGLGVMVPIAGFLVPYIRRHAVAVWLGNFLLIRGRAQLEAIAPASIFFILFCAPLLLVLLLNAECKHLRTRKIVTAVLFALLALLLIAALGRPLVSSLEWFSVAESLPALVVICVVVLWRKNLADRQPAQRLALLAFVVAMLGMEQFPFSAPVYFCFVAPVLFVMLAALAEQTKAPSHSMSPLLPVLVFFLLFGITAVLPSQLYLSSFARPPTEIAFTMPRASGLVADKKIVDIYEQTVAEILRHAGSAPIYAGPDSPGLYFLTGHRNPTRIAWEFLSGADADPERILKAIDTSGVQAVAINHGGAQWGPAAYNPSGPPSPELLDGLRKRFPQSTVIGFYEIRWKM